MSRKRKPKDTHALPTYRHVTAAVEKAFTTSEQEDIFAALDPLLPVPGGSKEYLQLVVIALARGNPEWLVELCETARTDPMQVHRRFIRTRPFSGWPQDWWQNPQ